MLMRTLPFLLLFALASNVSAQDEGIQFFEAKIRPVLSKHCYECHSETSEKVKGELLLDTREGLLRGGAGGAAIVPFESGEGLLMEAIRYVDTDIAMPPKKSGGKLPDSVIADFETWIAMGAPDPRDGESKLTKIYDGQLAKDWWAYQPVLNPAVPSVQNAEWSRSSIDRFILARLESENLAPVRDADPSSLLRRVFLDLTGLPPDPDFLAKYLASPTPDIYERIVDWLLASPQFGERWGRHWLDVARYAETTGRDVNMTMPEAWRYRDYVIDSFTQDKPFDQFIREQIAGDLLTAKSESDRAENLIATGFLAIGPKGLNETDPRQFAVDIADEQIDTVTQAFMGMTVSCARCHDHKFDPITQADYTAVAGIFLSTDTKFGTPGGVRARNAADLLEVSPAAELVSLIAPMDADEYAEKISQLETINSRRDEALASRRGGGTDTEMSGFDIVRMMTRAKQIEVELAAYNPDGSAKPRIIGVQDKPVTAPVEESGTSRRRVGGPNSGGRQSSGFEMITDSPFFARGDIEKEEETVPRGAPGFISRGRSLDIPAQSSGRLELADWIASPQNTLTARVTVNRVWRWLFGRGLVETVDNFGASGTAPSHPELLDHLARQFIADGWSIKTLVKRIVTSRVYQLDTVHAEANFAADPDNALLWRHNTRRLDAETIRDSILAASGQLDRTRQEGSLVARAGDGPVGGQRFQVLKEEELASANGNFRSIYLPLARNVQPEMLAVFDFAEPSVVLGSRNTTIVPPQALYLMNSEFVEEQATALAKRVMQGANGFDARFSFACRLVWGREPFREELGAARGLRGDDLTDWTSICRALFASADFLFIN